MDKGNATRYSVVGVSLLVFASALALAFGAGLSTVPRVRAQGTSSDPTNPTSWSLSSSSDWWNNSRPTDNDVRTTIDSGGVKLTGENAVGWWSMDNFPTGWKDTDNTVYDLSSLDNNGTAKDDNLNDSESPQGPTIENGRWDNALRFDGSDDIVEIGRISEIDTSSGATFMAWVNTDVDHNGIFISGDDEFDNNRIFQIKKKDTGTIRVIYSSDDNITNDLGTVVESDAQPNNEWVHAAFTTDDSGVKLFIGGEKVAENSSVMDDGDPAYILGRQEPSGANPFDGMVDGVIFFDRSLSGNEIKRVCERTKPPSLTSSENLESGSWGSVIHDFGPEVSADNVAVGPPKGGWNDWENDHVVIQRSVQAHNPNPVPTDGWPHYMFIIDGVPNTDLAKKNSPTDNWTVVKQDIIGAEVNAVMVKPGGKVFAYTGDSGEIDLFVSDNIGGPYENRGAVITGPSVGDSGVIRDPGTGKVYLYYENGSVESTYCGERIDYSTSPDGENSFEYGGTVVNSSATDYDIGDPEPLMIGNTFHMMADWNLDSSLDQIRHFYGDNFCSLENGPIVRDNYPRGSDVGDGRLVYWENEWKMYYETHADNDEVWVAESANGPWRDNVKVKVGADNDSDGVVEENSQWFSASPDYSLKHDNSKVYNGRWSGDLSPLPNSSRFRIYLRLEKVSGQDPPKVERLSLNTNCFPTIENVTANLDSVDMTDSTPLFDENSSVVVTSRVRDNNGNVDLKPLNLKMRDAGDTEVLDENITENTEVDENMLKYKRVYNPSSDVEVGPFDVYDKATDDGGLTCIENYGGLGENLFIVTDLTTTLNISDTTPAKGEKITISGTASRVYGTISLDNVVVEVNGELHQADFDENGSWSYRHTVRAPKGSEVDVKVHLLDRGSSIDGTSSTWTFTVQEVPGGVPIAPAKPQPMKIEVSVGRLKGGAFVPSERVGTGQIATVRIKLTSKGEPVKGADVGAWWIPRPTQAKTEAIEISEVGGGVYQGSFSIPEDVAPGTYEVSASAEKPGYEKAIGYDTFHVAKRVAKPGPVEKAIGWMRKHPGMVAVAIIAFLLLVLVARE